MIHRRRDDVNINCEHHPYVCNDSTTLRRRLIVLPGSCHVQTLAVSVYKGRRRLAVDWQLLAPTTTWRSDLGLDRQSLVSRLATCVVWLTTF